MPTLDPATLRPGSRLPMPLFNRQGVKLLAEGTVLSDETCRAIGGSGWGELYLARTSAEVAASVEILEAMRQSEREALAARETAQELMNTPPALRTMPRDMGPRDIGPREMAPRDTPGDESPPSEAAADEPVIIGHEIRRVTVPFDAEPPAPAIDRESVRRRAARFKAADAHVAALERLWRDLPLRVRTSARQGVALAPGAPLVPHEATPPFPDAARLLAMRRERGVRVRRMIAGLLGGAEIPVRTATDLVSELTRLHAAHPERFAMLPLMAGRHDDDLAEQCDAASALAVAIAARLGWSEADRREAGVAALLADLGMAAVPPELRHNARPLDELELHRVRRHPTLGVVLLSTMHDVSDRVRRAVYEHHERINGSGYPRALRGGAISDLGQVAALATMFAAMTSLRRYRLTRRPYDALEEIIMLASSGALRRDIVRALVEAVGLFPVGSWVRLTSGAVGQVVSADPARLDRPGVRIATAHDGRVRQVILHLADYARDEIAVEEAIDAPESHGV
jgi:HD-GYP domain-containing protein (c-di-GMP phosphodiesterase class II)